MKRFSILLCTLCALCGGALAQTFTNVTGTVLDKNGLPYASGTVQVQFVNVSGGASPTITATGAPLQTNPAPTQISLTGTFGFGLIPNSSISPAGTQYNFLICPIGSPSNLPDPMLIGQGCFSTGPITISGTSQSITSNINAVPPTPLTTPSISWSVTIGGTGLQQVTTQSILTNGTGIAPGTSQAQTAVFISGLTTNSVCYASPAGPLPGSWLNGVQIGFVAVAANTATPYLTNSTSSLVSPAAIQLNVRCIS